MHTNVVTDPTTRDGWLKLLPGGEEVRLSDGSFAILYRGDTIKLLREL